MSLLQQYFLAGCLFVAMISCSERNIRDEESSTRKIYKVSLANQEDQSDSLSFAKMLGNRSYVPLETNEKCFIGSVSKIIFFDSLLYILDKQLSAVNVFDLHGHFQFSVGRIGEAPGEYERLDDMEIDSAKREILLWSNDNMSVFRYDLEGRFLAQEELLVFGSYLVPYKNNYLVYTGYNFTENGDHVNLVLCSQTGQLLKTYFPVYSSDETISFGFAGFLRANPFGGISFAHALSDTIYHLSDSDGRFYPRFIIDLGDQMWSKHFSIFDHQRFLAKGIEYDLLFNSIYETPEHLFFSYLKNRQICKGMFLLDNGKLLTNETFEDDIDFSLFNIPVGQLPSGALITYLKPANIIKEKDKSPERFDQWLASDAALQKMMVTLKSDNNPVLVFFSMPPTIDYEND